jgi:hypothetical protein
MHAAAEKMCDVFGSIMNYGDGLYGGRFVAGMYTRAYLEKETTPQAVRRCLDAGLASIPYDSRYARTIRDVIVGYEQHPSDWKKTWDLIQKKWGDQDLCPEGYNRPFNIDAKINGAYIAIGLLYGGGDFDKTLEITARCGQDADCNPSNAAGVLGALYGYTRIPERYTRGIPSLTGRKFEYTDYDFPELIGVCERVFRRILAQNGGSVKSVGGEEILVIPVQNPRAPKKLVQVEDYPKKQILLWSREFDVRRIRAMAPHGWSGGWMIKASGSEMDPGIRPLWGKESALITHPESQSEPAALERRVRVPDKSPRLLLEVASFDRQPRADWELRVKVDGTEVLRETINEPGRWKTIEVDLSRHRGRTVNIRLENAAGGANAWSWEAGYWGRAEIVGE